MATLQDGKCFTVPTFFGMCCRSEWQERIIFSKWHEVDHTKHEIFCVHIVCNEIQVKVNLEITTFFFLFAFSILSQLFLIWGCTLHNFWSLVTDCMPFKIILQMWIVLFQKTHCHYTQDSDSVFLVKIIVIEVENISLKYIYIFNHLVCFCIF